MPFTERNYDHSSLPVCRSSLFALLAALAAIMISLSLLLSCGEETAPTVPQQPAYVPEWPRAAPEEHGFDPIILDTVTQRITYGEYGPVTSLLIVRHGYLVYEEYFFGMRSDSLHVIHSCTKSITSALIGVAIEEGLIPGVDARLVDYFQGYDVYPYAQDSIYREALTLEYMLQMTAGFDWDELSLPYGDVNNSWHRMTNSPDIYDYVLSRPIVFEPGTVWTYNSGVSELLGGILTQATGTDVAIYADQKLFSKIGIDTVVWSSLPPGVHQTSDGIRMRPRDMAKFGWLYAQHGVWKGDTVVPAAWIAQSTQPYSTTPDGRGYGYQWWMLPVTNDSGDPMLVPYALGYGEQHILFVSDLEIVIVVTARNFGSSEYRVIGLLDLIGQALTE